MNAELAARICTNPDNENVFAFLGVNVQENMTLSSGREVSGFDEGGVIFFQRFGELLPEHSKYIFDGNNVFVNEENGQIFALHYGRYTFLIRPDFSKAGVSRVEPKLTAYTLDDLVDFTVLGADWTLLDWLENKQEQVKWAYEQSKRHG